MHKQDYGENEYLVISISFIFSMLFISCFPGLERKNVPIIAGISIETKCSSLNIPKGLQLNQSFGINEWMIEVPFQMQAYDQASSFKYYERHELDTILPILQAHKTPYNLCFNVENPRNIPYAKARVEHYLTDMSGILLRALNASYLPKRIIFMGEVLNKDFSKGKLERFILEIRNELPAFGGEIVFAAKPSQIKDSSFVWDICDVVGVVYHEPPDLDYKPYFREINQSLSQLLVEHQKPVLIVHTNLVGKEKLLMFKNQLRFWDKEVELKGIVLNSLFCESPLADSSSHFGLANDRDFQRYLKRYMP